MTGVLRTGAMLLVAALLGGSATAAPVDRYGITPEEHAACDTDALALCVDAIPDVGKTLACMKEKVRRLSPTCAAVFKAGLKRRGMTL